MKSTQYGDSSVSVIQFYCVLMEDGPEKANGSYEYAGRTFHLRENDRERWFVYDAGIHIGTLVARPGQQASVPEYSIDIADGYGVVDEAVTDDWRRALETLIDQATP